MSSKLIEGREKAMSAMLDRRDLEQGEKTAADREA